MLLGAALREIRGPAVTEEHGSHPMRHGIKACEGSAWLRVYIRSVAQYLLAHHATIRALGGSELVKLAVGAS